MEYLGFGITRDGVKPININIEAITNMKPPNTHKKRRKFISVINYYRNMWPWRSHTLLPLTRLRFIKTEFKWAQVKQYALEEIKRIVACNTLSTYLGFNKYFNIHTNDRAIHYRVVVIQKGKPITFYSINLNGPPKRYIVTGKNL